uniref:Retrovirus-related Pol polyprotein from transposon TNT 1-94 n=1 Tax=Tanacetum cinerariifolium TaxID=118510 RepID=A0A6L2KHD8_TANCI|nr:retrovirus-related Pol polyprotein from transposon TNT 1-94 [Tanacetum cinerariifolium]
MSLAEAEYVAAAGCCANILWMKSQLTDYDIIYEKVFIFCDNTSAIAISNNPIMHSRTKHIDIRYHILKGDIKLHFIPTQYQLTDIFTKPLDEPTFKRLIVELEPFTKSSNMYKEYLVEFWYSAKALENSKVSFSVSAGGIYGEVGALKPNQPEEPPFINHMLDIYTAAKPVKESSSAMDSNSSQTLASTPVVAEMHKEDQQATGGPTSLGFTSEARANPQLSSGNNASAVFVTEADHRKFAPSDFIPQQQGMNERTKNTSYDHLFAGKRDNSIARQVEEDEASRTIKLEDLAKLVSSVQPSFKDLDSPEDDHIIVVDDSDEDEEADKAHATTNAETNDASVPKSSSPSSKPTELKELLFKFNELTKEELSAEFLSVPTQVEVIQAKLKTLDALPSLLHKVTNALNQFAQAIASKKTKDDSVPPAGQAGPITLKVYREDGTSEIIPNFRANDLYVGEWITLKVYREDGTSEIIPNFKASDMHLGEWREVINACPNRTGKGWTTIYDQIRTRMDYIHTTEAELANKRLKSSVQYEDHLAGTMLNEPILGMIMFNSYHRQDFVTIEDLKDFSNTMLYTIQKIFFRRHQGPGLDDHARTFSSFLLIEVDNRNLNPLKQIRTIKQLRQ